MLIILKFVNLTLVKINIKLLIFENVKYMIKMNVSPPTETTLLEYTLHSKVRAWLGAWCGGRGMVGGAVWREGPGWGHSVEGRAWLG